MIQARIGAFETNSSTYCSLWVEVAQVEGLDIQPIVKFESSGDWNDNMWYVYHRAESSNELDRLFGLLKYSGVKEIFVDNKPVEGEFTDHHPKFMRPECILAACFGTYKRYSEYEGHGDECDNSKWLKPSQILEIQNYLKDPNYVVFCDDGAERNAKEIEFPYKNRVITEQELERERKITAYENAPVIDYGEDSSNYNDDEFVGGEDYYDKLQNKAKNKRKK